MPKMQTKTIVIRKKCLHTNIIITLTQHDNYCVSDLIFYVYTCVFCVIT